jgi:hypothetical protein
MGNPVHLPGGKISELSAIMYELLEYGGIICGEEVTRLYLWRVQGDVPVRKEITTLEELLTTFGPGTYQIEVNDPTIEGIDPESYMLGVFIVEINYLPSGKWSDPRIHTETEDLPPDYVKDGAIDVERVEKRTRRLAKKVEGAMTLLSIFADFYQTVWKPAPKG